MVLGEEKEDLVLVKEGVAGIKGVLQLFFLRILANTLAVVLGKVDEPQAARVIARQIRRGDLQPEDGFAGEFTVQQAGQDLFGCAG